MTLVHCALRHWLSVKTIASTLHKLTYKKINTYQFHMKNKYVDRIRVMYSSTYSCDVFQYLFVWCIPVRIRVMYSRTYSCDVFQYVFVWCITVPIRVMYSSTYSCDVFQYVFVWCIPVRTSCKFRWIASTTAKIKKEAYTSNVLVNLSGQIALIYFHFSF